jgi:hypothetical protein
VNSNIALLAGICLASSACCLLLVLVLLVVEQLLGVCCCHDGSFVWKESWGAEERGDSLFGDLAGCPEKTSHEQATKLQKVM